MQLIVISGPSGSGKTTISKEIIRNFKYGIILNTDNYYKTGILNNILAKVVRSYYDKPISFNIRLFKNDLELILKNRSISYSYEYNFERKSLNKIYKEVKKIDYVVLEGIFIQDVVFSMHLKGYILVELKTNKKSCLKRVIQRDFIERGKNKIQARKEFLEGWAIFNKNKNKNKNKNRLKKNITKIVIKENDDAIALIKKTINFSL